MEEKAARVSRCSDEVCTGLVEETLDGEITLLVKAILEAELQRIHKYIKRYSESALDRFFFSETRFPHC